MTKTTKNKGNNAKKPPPPSSYAKVWYDIDNPASFSNIKALKQSVPGATSETTKEWLRTQDVYTLHRQARKRLKPDRIIVSGKDVQRSVDVADFAKYAAQNDNYRFLLIAVDSLSKFAFVQPMYDKSGPSIVKAFKNMFKSGRKPRQIRSDRGREFRNKQLTELLSRHNIVQYFAVHRTKASISERYIRTLKAKMYRYFTASGSQRYVDVLQSIVRGYNHTVHSTIDMKPAEVTDYNAEKVWRKLYGDLLTSQKKKKKINKPLFAEGDMVRISRDKPVFDKGFSHYWVREVFVVHKITGGSLKQPFRYTLKDREGQILEGSFKEEELQKVKPESKSVKKVVKRTKEKALVQWRGIPAKMETMDQSMTPWNCFNYEVPKQEVVYLAQIGIIYILVSACLINLALSVQPTELWVALLSSSVGYIMPTPALSYNRRDRDGGGAR